jgi:hypothetical protein
MADLVAPGLALPGRPAESLECLQEERLDVVRLQPPGFCTFHLFADALNLASIHGALSQGALIEQILDMAAVQRVIKAVVKRALTSGLLAVADGLKQQVAQRRDRSN